VQLPFDKLRANGVIYFTIDLEMESGDKCVISKSLVRLGELGGLVVKLLF